MITLSSRRPSGSAPELTLSDHFTAFSHDIVQNISVAILISFHDEESHRYHRWADCHCHCYHHCHCYCYHHHHHNCHRHHDAYFLKARVRRVQTPQTISNFPQKDRLRMQKESILHCLQRY